MSRGATQIVCRASWRDPISVNFLQVSFSTVSNVFGQTYWFLSLLDFTSVASLRSQSGNPPAFATVKAPRRQPSLLLSIYGKSLARRQINTLLKL